MAPSDRPVTVTTDLRTTVPAEWVLKGLSNPRSDGVNEFRVPDGATSTFQFTAPGATFAELEFQLYSPVIAVTGTVLLDGREIGQKTFPAGTFVANQRSGGFVQAGRHELTIMYHCQNGPCTMPISQYWTQVRLTPARPNTARIPVGLNTERWILNAPDSPLTVTGTGALRFDGVNYVQFIPGSGIQITWPESPALPLNATMQIYAPQAIKVTTTVASKVVSIQWGDASHAVLPVASLTADPGVRSVSVKVECVSKTAVNSGCAYLYFPQLSVMTPSPHPINDVLGAAAAVILALLLLTRWLRLVGPVAVVRQ